MSVITYKDLGEIVPSWVNEQEMLKSILSENYSEGMRCCGTHDSKTGFHGKRIFLL